MKLLSNKGTHQAPELVSRYLSSTAWGNSAGVAGRYYAVLVLEHTWSGKEHRLDVTGIDWCTPGMLDRDMIDTWLY